MKSVRFCVVGAGRAGLVHARNIATRIGGAELAVLCDSDEAVLREVARELGVGRVVQDYREAVRLDDVDAVVVVTPTFTHRDIACEAARIGKHVFLEKPMALTADECRSILSAVENAGVKLQLGFMRRFHGEFVRAKEILDTGDMGRVMTVKSIGRGPGLPPPWIYDVRKCNGILAEVNSHDFDAVRWLAGSDIVRVYAEAGNFKIPEVRDEFPEFYDNAVVTLRFAGGALGTIDGTCPAHYGYDARMEVLCENGLLQVGSVDEGGVSQVRKNGEIVSRAVRSWRTLFKDAYLAEMEHFVECIVQDRQPRVTGLDGLKAVEAVVAANQSILTGRPVEIA